MRDRENPKIEVLAEHRLQTSDRVMVEVRRVTYPTSGKVLSAIAIVLPGFWVDAALFWIALKRGQIWRGKILVRTDGDMLHVTYDYDDVPVTLHLRAAIVAELEEIIEKIEKEKNEDAHKNAAE